MAKKIPARKVTAINLGADEASLIDRISGMLERGELRGAPADFYEARRKLERRRRRIARLVK